MIDFGSLGQLAEDLLGPETWAKEVFWKKLEDTQLPDLRDPATRQMLGYLVQQRFSDSAINPGGYAEIRVTPDSFWRVCAKVNGLSVVFSVGNTPHEAWLQALSEWPTR